MQTATPSAPVPYDQIDLFAEPPAYSTLPQTPPPYAPSVGLESRGSRLCFQDFCPNLVSKTIFRPRKYEDLEMILKRVNTWLKLHEDIKVVSCESVTWTGLKFNKILSDNSSFLRNMSAGRRTKCLRGLRIWYLKSNFPNRQLSNESCQLEIKTFLPLKRETLSKLFHRVNEILASEGIPGKILNLETIWAKQSESGKYKPNLVEPNLSHWKIAPDETKTIIICLRVHILKHCGDELPESIGYKDFLPNYGCKPQTEIDSYDNFRETFEDAAKWMAQQQGVKFINVQTMSVKLKKNVEYSERCKFTEHLCATDRMNVLKGFNRTTHFIRIVRLFYTTPRTNDENLSTPMASITLRTFTPLSVVVASSRQPPQFENTRQVVERINEWLRMTGARIFHVETVDIKSQSIGSDETYFQRNSNNPGRERWLYHIRLYLDGEYTEHHGALAVINPTGNIVPSI